jgi:hypothetical protein
MVIDMARLIFADFAHRMTAAQVGVIAFGVVVTPSSLFVDLIAVTGRFL